MTQYVHQFEGGTNGAAISTSNSTFDAVAGSATGVFDTAHVAHGTLALSISTGASASTLVLTKQFPGATANGALRAYVYLTAAPSSALDLAIFRSGGTNRCRLRISTARKVQILNAAGSVVATSTTTLPTGQWVRIELPAVTLDSGSGAATGKIFLSADSSTADETFSVSAQNFGGTADRVVWGTLLSSTNLGPFWVDDLAENDTGAEIGPSTVTVGSSMGLVWNTRTTVGSSRQALWATRAAVGSSAQLVWSVRAAVGAARQLVWNVATAVGLSRALAWAVAVAAGASRALIWDTAAATGRSADLRWDTRAAIGASRDVRWAARTTVGDQRELDWAVRGVAGDSRQMLWSTAAVAGSSRTLRWHTRTAVGATRVLRWAVRTRVGSQADLRWSVQQVAGASITLRWDTLSAVGSQRQLVWRVREGQERDVTFVVSLPYRDWTATLQPRGWTAADRPYREWAASAPQH